MKPLGQIARYPRIILILPILLLGLSVFAGEAAADLLRVGPINPTPPVGNFPAWYQDNTGITLEFCDPKNDAELDGAWCLLNRVNDPLPGTPGVLSVPESFPGNFFDEHFYYSVAADTNGLPNAFLWEAAVEAAFAMGPAIPGDQVVFTRIRIRIRNLTQNGNYRIIHPYGVHVIPFDNNAGQEDQIFFTEDVGVAAGVFTGALRSKLGPFLLPSNTPGDAELPAVTGPAPGKLYIADPTRSGPVTGSPYDNNFVRVEGPADAFGIGIDNIQTNNFTLVGRIFSGVMPGDVTVDRAEYARNLSGQKVEVYATGLLTTPMRLPAGPPPTPFRPQLSFFDAPCVIGPDGYTYVAPGGTGNQMPNAGDNFWGQAPIAPIPQVCVEDSVSLAGFPKAVGDEIIISEAFFDPNAQRLSVKARSLDEVTPPTLTLEGFGDLTNGSILVPSLVAPPAYVRVLSSAGGSNEFQVTTSGGGAAAATGVAITPNLQSPQFPGTQLVFDADATPVGGTYEYQFWLYDYATEGPWTEVQPYSTLSSWTWNTAGLPGSPFNVAVFARSFGSLDTSQAIDNVLFSVVRPPVDNVTLTPSDPTQPHPAGTPVTFTAAADGGTGSYEYEFWFYNYQTEGPWGVVQPFSSDATWETPALLVPGSYNVAVYARSAGSPATSEQIASMIYVIGP
ncbi:MAG: hypothetical protein H6Q79_1458 [Deltaproteobacteria bacterium]|nr:hypothetical protein [Deltaproteobacteria bacterium]